MHRCNAMHRAMQQCNAQQQMMHRCHAMQHASARCKCKVPMQHAAPKQLIHDGNSCALATQMCSKSQQHQKRAKSNIASTCRIQTHQSSIMCSIGCPNQNLMRCANNSISCWPRGGSDTPRVNITTQYSSRRKKTAHFGCA